MSVGRVKIVTFVPVKNADQVRETLGSAEAGVIGEYSYCSFSSIGQGRFLPSKNTNPHIGQPNKLEMVEEERIEVVCDRNKAKNVISVMKQVHPYEEVAFDIYPLLSENDL